MSVAPEFAAVLEGFQLSSAAVRVEPHGSGHINHSYRVTCEDGARYLLQRINTAIFTQPALLMENIERVTAHIAAKVAGEPDAERRVLTLVPACDGRSWLQLADGCWRVFRLVERSRSYDNAETPAQAFRAARAFGEFQQQLADLPADSLHDTLAGFHDTPRRFAALEAAIQEDAAGRASSVAAEIDFALTQKSLASLLVNAGLPQRVIHNDTKLNNVLFDADSDETLCVVDLDTVMPGLALYDFGDMVRTTSTAAAEDETDLSLVTVRLPMFEALVSGYVGAAEGFLTPQERALLPMAGQVITFEQGVRFLADHLAGDTYYKISRPGQNLDRCRTQFALLADLQRREAEMRRIVNSL